MTQRNDARLLELFTQKEKKPPPVEDDARPPAGDQVFVHAQSLLRGIPLTYRTLLKDFMATAQHTVAHVLKLVYFEFYLEVFGFQGDSNLVGEQAETLYQDAMVELQARFSSGAWGKVVPAAHEAHASTPALVRSIRDGLAGQPARVVAAAKMLAQLSTDLENNQRVFLDRFVDLVHTDARTVLASYAVLVREFRAELRALAATALGTDAFVQCPERRLVQAKLNSLEATGDAWRERVDAVISSFQQYAPGNAVVCRFIRQFGAFECPTTSCGIPGIFADASALYQNQLRWNQRLVSEHSARYQDRLAEFERPMAQERCWIDAWVSSFQEKLGTSPLGPALKRLAVYDSLRVLAESVPRLRDAVSDTGFPAWQFLQP